MATMKRKCAFSLLAVSLLAGCAAESGMSRDEAIAKLQMLEVAVNASPDFIYPSKYTFEESFDRYVKDGISIDEALIHTELSLESLYYHSRLSGKREGDTYFAETYIFVSDDSTEVLARDVDAKSREQVPLAERSWEEIVSTEIAEMNAFVSESAFLVALDIGEVATDGNFGEEEYISAGEGDLSGSFTYALDGDSGSYSFVFEDCLLRSRVNFDSALSIRWEECETSTPNVRDYE